MHIKTIHLGIEGMTCSGCSTHIENITRQIEGIQHCAIQYQDGSGTFTYDADRLTPADIERAINSLGPYRVVGTKGEDQAGEEALPRVKNTSKKDYNLIIIGGGSAAFSAAITAESMGLSTLLVNAGLDFGGTCVNVGCVPSKILIRAGETLHRATHSNFSSIVPKGAALDFSQLIKDKKDWVADLQKQKYLDVVRDFEHLTLRKGWATLVDAQSIRIDGKEVFSADKILLATGSSTHIPDIEGLEEVGYYTNATLFDLEEKPDSMTILGAGYIGMEIAQAYSRLGVKVRIIHFTDRPLRSQTSDITDVLVQQFQREEVQLLPNYKAFRMEKRGRDTAIHCQLPDGSTRQLIERGAIVVASGTRPNTSQLGIENTGLQRDERGSIIVNEKMETNIPTLYAAGDVTQTPAYVYTAAAEGKAAVNNAYSDKHILMDYSSLPWVVFTDPQVAGTGIDEVEAERRNIPFEVSKLDLTHVPRAIAARDTRGFIKLIRNTQTDCLIGARVVAPEGGELIQSLSMAIKYGIPVKELANSLYPYLTLGEGIKLAAITFGKDVAKLSCCAS